MDKETVSTESPVSKFSWQKEQTKLLKEAIGGDDILYSTFIKNFKEFFNDYPPDEIPQFTTSKLSKLINGFKKADGSTSYQKLTAQEYYFLTKYVDGTAYRTAGDKLAREEYNQLISRLERFCSKVKVPSLQQLLMSEKLDGYHGFLKESYRELFSIWKDLSNTNIKVVNYMQCLDLLNQLLESLYEAISICRMLSNTNTEDYESCMSLLDMMVYLTSLSILDFSPLPSVKGLVTYLERKTKYKELSDEKRNIQKMFDELSLDDLLKLIHYKTLPGEPWPK